MVEHRLIWNLTILKLSFRNGQNVNVKEKKANVHGVKFTKFDVSNWDELRLRMSHFHQKTSPDLKNNHKMHLTKNFSASEEFSNSSRPIRDPSWIKLFTSKFQLIRKLLCKNVNKIVIFIDCFYKMQFTSRGLGDFFLLELTSYGKWHDGFLN